MTRMATPEEIADHDRDLRKHDTLPSRLDRPITTAQDIALCVRGMKNIVDAAALIEQYADMKVSVARAEDAHQRWIAARAALESPLVRKEPV